MEFQPITRSLEAIKKLGSILTRAEPDVPELDSNAHFTYEEAADARKWVPRRSPHAPYSPHMSGGLARLHQADLQRSRNQQPDS